MRKWNWRFIPVVMAALCLALVPLDKGRALGYSLGFGGRLGGFRIPSAQGYSESQIQQGYAIAPVSLNVNGKNAALVGLGSYLVNAVGGCNDCHTVPPYTTGHNPFLGQPEQINATNYLAGGDSFGPIVSSNITPDVNGLPAGLTLDQFIQVMRTGEDPNDPGTLLQVMPWPSYGKMTNLDLTAMYDYLTAIPHAEPPPAS